MQLGDDYPVNRKMLRKSFCLDKSILSYGSIKHQQDFDRIRIGFSSCNTHYFSTTARAAYGRHIGSVNKRKKQVFSQFHVWQQDPHNLHVSVRAIPLQIQMEAD